MNIGPPEWVWLMGERERICARCAGRCAGGSCEARRRSWERKKECVRKSLKCASISTEAGALGGGLKNPKGGCCLLSEWLLGRSGGGSRAIKENWAFVGLGTPANGQANITRVSTLCFPVYLESSKVKDVKDVKESVANYCSSIQITIQFKTNEVKAGDCGLNQVQRVTDDD